MLVALLIIKSPSDCKASKEVFENRPSSSTTNNEVVWPTSTNECSQLKRQACRLQHNFGNLNLAAQRAFLQILFNYKFLILLCLQLQTAILTSSPYKLELEATAKEKKE